MKIGKKGEWKGEWKDTKKEDHTGLVDHPLPEKDTAV